MYPSPVPRSMLFSDRRLCEAHVDEARAILLDSFLTFAYRPFSIIKSTRCCLHQGMFGERARGHRCLTVAYNVWDKGGCFVSRLSVAEHAGVSGGSGGTAPPPPVVLRQTPTSQHTHVCKRCCCHCPGWPFLRRHWHRKETRRPPVRGARKNAIVAWPHYHDLSAESWAPTFARVNNIDYGGAPSHTERA